MTAGHTEIDPYGTMLIASPFHLLAGGSAPGSQSVTIPTVAGLAGTMVYIQGIVATAAAADITQHLHLTFF